jgi:TonB family protein
MMHMQNILILIIAFSFTSIAMAERDEESIREVAQAYREQRINTGSFGVRQEVRANLLAQGHTFFPDATNLPTLDDVHKKWTNAKLLKAWPLIPKRGVLGHVEVAILIDENGKVIDTYIIESTDEKFNASAETAVRSWEFKPALLDDKASKTVWIIPFDY